MESVVERVKDAVVLAGGCLDLTRKQGVEMVARQAGARLRGLAHDGLFQRLPDEACVEHVANGYLDHFSGTLGPDPHQARLRELDEGLPHRLPGDAETGADIRFRNRVARLEFQTHNGVAQRRRDALGNRLAFIDENGRTDIHHTNFCLLPG